MGFDLTVSGSRQSGRSCHSLVFAGTLAASLVSAGGSSGAEPAVQRDIGDYLMRAVQPCWNVPANATSTARVRISLNKDGSLAGPPKIVGPVTSARHKVAEAAIRAITRCAPFPGLASYGADYDLWRDIVVTFNPAVDPAAGHPSVDIDDLDKLLGKYMKVK
ncbi:cell envelope integrity protein TolA [Mesorhizobium sp. B2-5-9]|uniref:cell envelope integrity protein TolA n=1 Tax=Mesorhizobium sp. B2-5-9 TaxID=2589921 RepID=UPI00112DCB77|nr:cell envelope integrity protein TolA [Mesorhizobium sp. B2-5-9]TPK16533.1 cell envelope integrity protein TolA [Mesorhizobium sp. B2-5-9]